MEQNFNDLYSSLPEKDRELLVSNLIRSLKGEPTVPISRIVTGKISTNATIEEQKEAIEKLMGFSPGFLKDVDIKFDEAPVRENFLASQKVIAEQLAQFKMHPKTTTDKYQELEHLGKFIVATGEPIVIEVQEQPLTYPDFVVQFNGKRIGIEHTRLMDREVNKLISVNSKYLDQAKEIILLRDPGITGILNVSFHHFAPVVAGKSFNDISFTKEEREGIPKKIAMYLIAYLRGTGIEKPAYIQSVSFTPNPGMQLDIIYREQYLGKKDEDDLLMKTITPKEERFISYAQNKTLDEFWLLVVLDGIRASSNFKFTVDDLPSDITSHYNRIYLFEAFNNNLFLIPTLLIES